MKKKITEIDEQVKKILFKVLKISKKSLRKILELLIIQMI